MAKIQRHEAAWISAPPPSGPITVKIPAHAVQLPIAPARSDSGKVSMISARALGTNSAPATPWIVRAAISNPALGEIAHSSEQSANASNPARNTRRRPNRSPSEPPTSSSAARVSR